MYQIQVPDDHPIPDLPAQAYRMLLDSDGQNFSQFVQFLRRDDEDCSEASHLTKVRNLENWIQIKLQTKSVIRSEIEK